MSITVQHAGPAPAGRHRPAQREPSGAPDAPTPSQRIIAQANEVIRVTDPRGRVIGYKKLAVLDRARMFEVVGADNTRNEAFLSIAVPSFMTVEVGGHTLGHPATRRQLDARMELLGDDGLDAINRSIVENFGDGDDDAATGEQLKNAQGIPDA